MSLLENIQELDRPPDALIEALGIVAAWERGESISDPEALAVRVYLQRAALGRQASTATIQLTEV
jgi:hypothetical protein